MSSNVITGEKSPGVALTLNLCIPFVGLGLGYFYIGQWVKGLITILSNAVGIGWIVWCISLVDAYGQAKVLKEGGGIGQFTFFSSAAHVPAPYPPQHQPPSPGYNHPAPKPASDQVSQVVHDVGKEIEGILDKAKSPSSKKVCLSCGQQIDLRYMVCPFCQAPVTGPKQPGSGVVEY